MTTWKELKNDLSINQEDQNAIALEKDRIRTMNNWFTIDRIDDETIIISECRH